MKTIEQVREFIEKIKGKARDEFRKNKWDKDLSLEERMEQMQISDAQYNLAEKILDFIDSEEK